MRKEVEEIYNSYGINVNEAIKTLKNICISLHCWQIDDIQGFENSGGLSGGIQTTGNHFGKARDFTEFKQDFDMVLKHITGRFKINLHAIYQSDNVCDRKNITYKQYLSWVNYAKEKGLGLDFNPTVFSSPMLVDGLSLSSPDKNIRDYWIQHCQNAIKVSEYFGKELNKKSLCNIWIPDGLKDNPADRKGPRERLKASLDEVLSINYDKEYVDISLESKVFGIGVESYTVGSHEFYMNYTKSKNILYLLDTGHFHPTESVADKISSILLFNNQLAFHVSRPVRWDSDHVLRLNDDLQDVADELVKCNALEKTYIGLDYFDGSINRIAALVVGTRNMQKALLKALLTPWSILKKAQDEYNHSLVFALQEEIKALPWNEVWNEFLEINELMTDRECFKDIMKYEKEFMTLRK